MRAPSANGAPLEEALLLLDDPRAREIPALLVEMGACLRRHREVTQLQVTSALAAVSLHEGVARVFPHRLFLFETRMLGLLNPAIVVASPPIPADSPPQGGPTRVVVLFVGTPVPSPGETRLRNHLRASLARKEVAWRLLCAQDTPTLKKSLKVVDTSWIDPPRRDQA